MEKTQLILYLDVLDLNTGIGVGRGSYFLVPLTSLFFERSLLGPLFRAVSLPLLLFLLLPLRLVTPINFSNIVVVFIVIVVVIVVNGCHERDALHDVVWRILWQDLRLVDADLKKARQR